MESGLVPHSTAHRPHGFRRVHLPGNFPIGNRLAVWNFGESVPNTRLDLAANQLLRDGAHLSPLIKVVRKLHLSEVENR